MNNKEVSKIKIETTALMIKSFLTDFTPQLENIKKYAENLTTDNVEENKKLILEQINFALSLLNQMQTIEQRMENDLKYKTSFV